jgi:four helix bundle protein
MTKEDLKKRTKLFALRIIKMGKVIKADDVDKLLLKQLIRSATSVAANYRAALKAKSTKDFIYKLAIIEEEADESYFWLELMMDAEIVKPEKIAALTTEAKELTAIFTAQGKTSKENYKTATTKIKTA